jgi:hypothetical protein
MGAKGPGVEKREFVVNEEYHIILALDFEGKLQFVSNAGSNVQDRGRDHRVEVTVVLVGDQILAGAVAGINLTIGGKQEISSYQVLQVAKGGCDGTAWSRFTP